MWFSTIFALLSPENLTFLTAAAAKSIPVLKTDICAILDYHLNQISTFLQNFEANQVILKDVFFSRKQCLDWKILPCDPKLVPFVAII